MADVVQMDLTQQMSERGEAKRGEDQDDADRERDAFARAGEKCVHGFA